jgi:hypothetical protein
MYIKVLVVELGIKAAKCKSLGVKVKQSSVNFDSATKCVV